MIHCMYDILYDAAEDKRSRSSIDAETLQDETFTVHRHETLYTTYYTNTLSHQRTFRTYTGYHYIITRT